MTDLPNLKVPRKDASDKLRQQIDEANKLKGLVINSDDEMKKAFYEFKKWHEYVLLLLEKIFDNNYFVKQYEEIGNYFQRILPYKDELVHYGTSLENRIRFLDSILNRIDLLDENLPIQNSNSTSIVNTKENSIFVVHGHDNESKEKVSRFIEKLGLKAIVLHEQPNSGRTIIEKFIDYSDAAFAVVLLTPDDLGFPKNNKDEVKYRSRQNVIFELGFFLGTLGREKVCALYKENVEIPSDYKGVLYHPLDDGGGWQLQLAKELKQAGLSIDMNKAIR